MRAVLVLVLLGGCLRTPPFAGTSSSPDSGIDSALDSDAAMGVSNVMFVTSTTTSVNQLLGFSNADMFCRDRAVAGGLSGTFVAWLSTSGMSAKSRLGLARGWVRKDGKAFADDVATLADGKIYYPPRLDENGTDIGSAEVMTGTQSDGTAAPNTCSNLAGGDITPMEVGYADGTSRAWTDSSVAQACSNSEHLYCFQIDLITPTAPPPSKLKRAFLSSPWTPGAGGVTSADATCQNDALANGLTGTFKALLSATGNTAAARFVSTTGPWARLDGVELAMTTQLFFGGKVDAPLNLDAAGKYHTDEQVWTGAGYLRTPSDSPQATCSDWTMAAGSDTGATGIANRTDVTWFGYASNAMACSAALPVYCLEI